MDYVTQLKRILQHGRTDIYGKKEVGKEFDKMAKNVKSKKYKELEKNFEELENAIRSQINQAVATSLFKKPEYTAIKKSLLEMEHTPSTVVGKSVVKIKKEAEMKAAHVNRQYMPDLTTIAESVNKLTGALNGSHHTPGQASADDAGYLPIPMPMTEDNIQRIQAHIESLQSEVETFQEKLINTCRPFAAKDEIEQISTKNGLSEILSQLETIIIPSNEMEKTQKTLERDGEQVSKVMDTDGDRFYKTRYQHIQDWIVWLHGVTESSKSQNHSPPDQPEQFKVKTPESREVKQMENILQETNAHIQQLSQRLQAKITEREAAEHEWNRKLQKAKERYEELESKNRQKTEPRIQSATRRDLQAEIERFRKENHRLTDDLHEAIAKKEYWITRLSSIAGAKLVDGNPAITDLSDPNRPQKLAERFAELYDNEWTNALEILADGNEKREHDTVRSLAALLKENRAITISIEVKSIIQDLQRKTANQAREAVFKNFGLNLEKDKKELHKVAKSIPRFVHECFEICWIMTLHNPQPCFFWPDTSKDKTIDGNRFTLFTKSGNTIDYVVWPAMQLHEGGPLLRKGVVQPIGNKNTNK